VVDVGNVMDLLEGPDGAVCALSLKKVQLRLSLHVECIGTGPQESLELGKGGV